MAEHNQFAKAEMLIRKPVREVFQAFINPEVTTKFWFTKSSGKLEEGKEVEWTWEMYNVTVLVTVKKIEEDKQIIVEWGNYEDLTTVEWTFKAMPDEATFVSVVNQINSSNADRVLSLVRESTEGFTLVLAGLKAYLEFGIKLNLVGDRFPKGLN
ncbi:SRPBCC family protein [Pedobacter punctiformis]|uniref:SRPBCC family protein n=1 Tax=Pedobacter punctiformis TaxID=3004097 RepID=A0ABT4L836_9SPHI|nr:SRPBCC family protein [Pedobacter sp. HCMS5-2]MCZ4244095.1 SRPBCC family protein [Pedobacter sp. HCMS5-2]